MDLVIPEEEKLAAQLAKNIHVNHDDSTVARARMLDAVGQFDEGDCAPRLGSKTTAAWLIRDLRIPRSTAFEYVFVARGIRQYRMLYESFEKARISYTTVRWLLNYMNEENEGELVADAEAMCFSELQQKLAGVEPNDGKDPTEPYFRLNKRKDGMVHLDVLLPAVTGEELLAALKLAQLANHGLEDAAPEVLDDPEALDALLKQAEATEECCPATKTAPPAAGHKSVWEDIKATAEALDEEHSASRFGPPEPRSFYSAFIAMINMVRTNPSSPLRTPGAHVNIMVTEDGRAWMPNNLQAKSSAVESYIANAMVRFHVVDSKGLTLNVSRQQRFATDGQVSALLANWGHQCSMPGCTHTRFLQMHHIKDWSRNGETNMDNLLPLCSSCHSLVSNNSIHIWQRGGDIHYRFADGTRYTSHNRTLPTAAPAPRTRTCDGNCTDCADHAECGTTQPRQSAAADCRGSRAPSAACTAPPCRNPKVVAPSP